MREALEHQHVGTTVQQPARLLAVIFHQFVERRPARRRAHAARHVPPLGLLPQLTSTRLQDVVVIFFDRLPRQLRASLRDIVGHVLQAVCGLVHGVRVAGQRTHHVDARFEIRAVHRLHAFGGRKAKRLEIIFQRYGMVREQAPAEVPLGKATRPEYRSKIPVHREDTAIAVARKFLI